MRDTPFDQKPEEALDVELLSSNATSSIAESTIATCRDFPSHDPENKSGVVACDAFTVIRPGSSSTKQFPGRNRLRSLMDTKCRCFHEAKLAPSSPAHGAFRFSAGALRFSLPNEPVLEPFHSGINAAASEICKI
jgi:hypothetical protein